MDIIKRLFGEKPIEEKKTELRVRQPVPVQHVLIRNPKPEGMMEEYMSVVGLTYDNEDGSSRQSILKKARVNDAIELKRAPMKGYPNAIQVHFKKQCIGYISEDDNKRLAKYMDGGGVILECQISHLYTNSKGIISTVEIVYYRNKMR